MLGAALTQTDGDWQLRTGVGRSGVAELTSAHRVGDDEFDADLVRAFEAASARLAPGVGRNVEAVLVRDAEGPARVVLVIHHLVVDAVSWRAVVEDLLTAWAQHSAGQPYSLRPEATSMRAWAMAQAERAADRRSELDYWLPRARVTDLGVELDRGRDREHTVQTVIEDVPADVTEAILTRVPAAFGGAVNDPLVAALARAVRSWQHAHGIVDEAPVALLVEGHGRYEEVLAAGSHPVRADLSRTVGWFTTIAPISVDPGVDVEHAVKAAKEERVNAPDRGIGFGLLRFGASPELAERPLPAISLNYLGNIAGGDEAVGDLLPAADAPRLPGTVRPCGRGRRSGSLTVGRGGCGGVPTRSGHVGPTVPGCRGVATVAVAARIGLPGGDRDRRGRGGGCVCGASGSAARRQCRHRPAARCGAGLARAPPSPAIRLRPDLERHCGRGGAAQRRGRVAGRRPDGDDE